MLKTTCLLLFTFTFLLAMTVLPGCNQLSEKTGVGQKEKTTVSVPFPELGEPVEVTVTASGKDGSEQGVRLLTVGEPREAIGRFEAVLTKHPKDHRTHFALGIARELTGQLPQAKQSYLAALALSGSQREYEQAIMRIKVKLGEDEM